MRKQTKTKNKINKNATNQYQPQKPNKQAHACIHTYNACMHACIHWYTSCKHTDIHRVHTAHACMHTYIHHKHACIHPPHAHTACMHTPHTCIHRMHAYTACMDTPHACIHRMHALIGCAYFEEVFALGFGYLSSVFVCQRNSFFIKSPIAVCMQLAKEVFRGYCCFFSSACIKLCLCIILMQANKQTNKQTNACTHANAMYTTVFI